MFDVFKPGVLAEVFPEVLDEMALGIYKAGLVLVVFFVFFQYFIQGCRVILLHVQVSFLSNERYPFRKLGLRVLLFGKGLSNPFSCRIEIVNLSAITAFPDCHGYPSFLWSATISRLISSRMTVFMETCSPLPIVSRAAFSLVHFKRFSGILNSNPFIIVSPSGIVSR